MSLQPAVCTSCGGRIKVDDVDLNGFGECEFCHVSYKVIDVITIDGLPTLKSLIENANIAVSMGNLEKAVKIYNDALLLKSKCHEAWWGLYICNKSFDHYYNYEDKYGNSGPYTKAEIMLNTLEKYAYRAIEYAPPEISKQYQSQISESINFIKSVGNGDYDKNKKKSGKGACYIATAVYGSYNCNKVMTLRKFRDEYLEKRLWGKIFISIYYKISPKLVKIIKKNSWIENKIRTILDHIIVKLNK